MVQAKRHSTSLLKLLITKASKEAPRDGWQKLYSNESCIHSWKAHQLRNFFKTQGPSDWMLFVATPKGRIICQNNLDPLAIGISLDCGLSAPVSLNNFLGHVILKSWSLIVLAMCSHLSSFASILPVSSSCRPLACQLHCHPRYFLIFINHSPGSFLSWTNILLFVQQKRLLKSLLSFSRGLQNVRLWDGFISKYLSFYSPIALVNSLLPLRRRRLLPVSNYTQLVRGFLKVTL